MANEADPADEQQSESFAAAARLAVGTHAVLVILILVLLCCMVPWMKAHIENLGGNLPIPTKILLSASDAMRANTLWLCPFALLLLWLDFKLYRHLYRRKSPAMARWLSRGITALLLAVFLFYLILACHFLHILVYDWW